MIYFIVKFYPFQQRWFLCKCTAQAWEVNALALPLFLIPHFELCVWCRTLADCSVIQIINLDNEETWSHSRRRIIEGLQVIWGHEGLCVALTSCLSALALSPQQWHFTASSLGLQQQLLPGSIFSIYQEVALLLILKSHSTCQRVSPKRSLILSSEACPTNPTSSGTSSAWQYSAPQRSDSQFVGSLLRACRLWQSRPLRQPYHHVEENEFILWGPWGQN